MPNLNELHIPLEMDDAMAWAVVTEYDLREDSWREVQLRARGLAEAFLCLNPELEWIHSLRAELVEEAR